MKNFGLFIIAAILMVSCNEMTGPGQQAGTEEQTMATAEPATDGVFIHITAGYDDPHRVLMPMKMATMMAQDKDVIVYLDIHAVNLVVKDADDLTFADFESFQTYVKKLAELNVGVYACPTCLNVAGFTPDELMEGVQAAQKDRFFDFTKGRIITLDY
jgi:predicted peroxiredoxin